MSILSRSRLPARQVSLALRANRAMPIRFASGAAYEPIPFKYKHKGRFAIKLTTFLLIGFTLPGWAAAYQIAKK
ncbi:hypothetical protein K488DRAFT_82850 [Vararia minispora EC-137]|uniref:Uncharacterized protein n=1 Tax=Vararia minispora EC-137 TaxID=1314806 RepID=A0ACB8QVY0_9AGAM|nr:hypothetical protein K488DRAFT_82850 [Vararia minispora EC-137]